MAHGSTNTQDESLTLNTQVTELLKLEDKINLQMSQFAGLWSREHVAWKAAHYGLWISESVVVIIPYRSVLEGQTKRLRPQRSQHRLNPSTFSRSNSRPNFFCDPAITVTYWSRKGFWSVEVPCEDSLSIGLIWLFGLYQGEVFYSGTLSFSWQTMPYMWTMCVCVHRSGHSVFKRLLCVSTYHH